MRRVPGALGASAADAAGGVVAVFRHAHAHHKLDYKVYYYGVGEARGKGDFRRIHDFLLIPQREAVHTATLLIRIYDPILAEIIQNRYNARNETFRIPLASLAAQSKKEPPSTLVPNGAGAPIQETAKKAGMMKNNRCDTPGPTCVCA